MIKPWKTNNVRHLFVFKIKKKKNHIWWKRKKYTLKRERALSYSTRKPILYKQFSTGETAQLHHTFIDSKTIYFVIHILRMFQKMQHASLSFISQSLEGFGEVDASTPLFQAISRSAASDLSGVTISPRALTRSTTRSWPLTPHIRFRLFISTITSKLPHFEWLTLMIMLTTEAVVVLRVK